MPRFATKNYEQILTQMLAKLVTRTKLSDISDTSAWKHVLAAAARQDEEQYYQMFLLLKLFDLDKCDDEDLIERAKEIQPGILELEGPRLANTNVVFYRNIVAGNIVVDKDTRIKTREGIEFKTTNQAVIESTNLPIIPGHTVGQDSSLIPAIAIIPGIDGNVEANTLIKFVRKPLGVDGVTNPAKALWGRDKETADSFRSRIRSYVSTLARGTVETLEAKVIGIQDPDTSATILFAKAIEDPINKRYVTLYIDDGTGYALQKEVVLGEILTEGLGGPIPNSAVGGEEYLFLNNKPIDLNDPFTATSSIRGNLIRDTDYYVNPASGQVNFTPSLLAGEIITINTYMKYTGLIALAQKVIDGDSTDRLNYPGYRSGGVLVQVKTPNIRIQNISVTITIKEGYDKATVLINVKSSIISYINSLSISQDIIRNELIKKIMNVSGVYDASLLEPLNNVIILDDQLVRTTDNNVSVN